MVACLSFLFFVQLSYANEQFGGLGMGVVQLYDEEVDNGSGRSTSFEVQSLKSTAGYEQQRRSETMPIYEYECKSCNNTFELLQKLSDDATGIKCPKCQSDNTERRYSTFCSSSGSPKASAPSGHSSPGHS